MSDERKQLEINWTSGDEQVTVEWFPKRNDIKIQSGLESMFIDQTAIDGLIKALQAIKEKMNEAEQ